MAKHISPAEIVEIQRLYRVMGTYAAVAKEMGRSASAVSKYVKMEDVPRNICIAVENLSRETKLCDRMEAEGIFRLRLL